MDQTDESNDVVHPEVRAHINSLVSALGGFSADDDGRYVLGDSAVEVLRDIKKWIRFYDEKTNRMDVARCLADANLVGGDLLHILAAWPENATDNKFKARAALACFEILVPLTWPLDRNPAEMTVNHHRHQPILHLAQLRYKRDIVNFDAARILHTAVRVALPSLALDRNKRTSRDDSLIKIVLLFLRNVAQIAPHPNSSHDADDSHISRSALIDAFSYQDILITILTLASNMGDDFNHEGVILLEIIFHLVKRVDVNKLFMDDKQLNKTKSNELTAMMNKEAAMHRPYNRKAPTRHNRWGAMVWVDRGDGKVSTVSGQDALLDSATRQHKMDSTKVYRPPRRPRKDQLAPQDLGLPVTLNTRARQQLKDFVSEFLDSGFNPLFTNVRKKLDEQKDYVFDYHPRQFFYLISWFLEAERIRQKATKQATPAQPDDVKSFNLVAGVLNQETFITMNRSIGDALESKNWPDLCAAMRCFTQILLTVQDMSESGNEDDEEIAENILSRIFYEEETHDRVANIARNYKDQGFEYLDACTELTHTYLRVLEAYSKQNVDMQVRSKRRVRKKKKAAKAAGEGDDENPAPEDESENDQADAEKVSRERKFDFTRFTARFVVQGVVDTFTAFTKFYQDLDNSQLKRAHRYFYRVAFKHEMSVMLFRVDIIQLLHGMIKGQDPLDKASPMYKEWEELSKQILRKCIRKIEDRPQLIIEMLFSKIGATAHYLEYGYEKQTVTTQTKPAAELEFRHTLEPAQQIGIAVGVLLDKNLAHHVKWVKDQLNNGISERKAWEAAEKAMPSTEHGDEAEPTEPAMGDAPAKEAPPITLRPEDDARRTAIFKNGHLRLLMKLVGFERVDMMTDETPESLWAIPSHLSVDALQNSLDHITQAEFDPPSFENGLLAEQQLRRKTAPRKKAVFDDDDDGDLPSNDDDILFPAGGPTARKDTAEKTKKKRVHRRRGSDAEEPSEEQLEERARARRDREREKALRFKSDLYVHASDDESGDEDRWADFYANEDRIRRMQQEVAERAARGFGASENASQKKAAAKPEKRSEGKKRKAKKTILSDDDDDDEASEKSSEDEAASAAVDGDESDASATPAAPAKSANDTPLSSPRSSAGGSKKSKGGAKKRRRVSPSGDGSQSDDAAAVPAVEAENQDVTMANADADADDDDEDAPVKPPPKRRPRGKAGFIMDSSDEE